MNSHGYSETADENQNDIDGNRFRFRSRGETQIARCLDRYGLAYLYEHPLAVVDQGKTKIWYPDFQLAGYGMLIEYFGRPDDPHYAAGMAKKKTVYDANGLSALMLKPDDLRGDWPGRLLGEIENALQHRLDTFHNACNDWLPASNGAVSRRRERTATQL